MATPNSMGGLVGGPQSQKASGEQQDSTALFDNLVGMDRGFETAAAGEPASPEEQAQFDELFGRFLDLIEGPAQQAVVKVMRSSGELFEGVSKAAFTILQRAKIQQEEVSGPVAPSVFFGEGGLLMSSVDAMFQIAQAAGIPGTEDEDQYTAAQFNMMKLVGEHLRKENDDDAVDEAQEFLLDIEMGPEDDMEMGPDVPPLDAEDRATLQGAAAEGSPAEQGPPQPAGEQGLVPEELPPELAGAPASEQGGLI